MTRSTSPFPSFSLVASLLSVAAVGSLVACSSSSSPSGGSTTTAEPAAPVGDAPPPAAEEDPKPSPPAPVDACGAVPKSQCEPANAGSVIRGIVKFDPKHYAGKKAPSLVVYLHHQVVMSASEATQGGHPHAFKTFEVKDVSKGEATFAIDMCELGTAMYSEENCGFNLVVMLDEDGKNDPDNGATAMIARKGQLVKMTPLDISCHAPSPCLTIQADCLDGDACTTFKPLTACKCGAKSCQSDNTICSK